MLSPNTRILLVLSGKGGVGKSSVATQVAIALADVGFSTGLLDVDLCGPSIPQMLGVVGSAVLQSQAGWVPVRITPTLVVMSIGFLTGAENQDEAIIWRGPKKAALIGQFFSSVDWPEALDFLVVDTPPGTSDEHIALVEHLLHGQQRALDALVITTPQSMALVDVKKEIRFCEKVGIRILGLIENMSVYSCPCCQTNTPIFAAGGGQVLANECNLPLLAKLPFDTTLGHTLDTAAAPLDRLSAISETRAYYIIKSTVQSIFGKKPSQ